MNRRKFFIKSILSVLSLTIPRCAKANNLSSTQNKKSAYNSSVILDKCKFPGCCRNATDTHHINEQKDSDENGNIGSFHKNNSHNLRSVQWQDAVHYLLNLCTYHLT